MTDATKSSGKMFDRSWWAMSLAARYASVAAHNAGIAVSVEVRKTTSCWEPYPCIVWRGTVDQFMATEYFADGIAAKQATGKWRAVEQLRGTVFPDGDGRFIFVIEGCNYRGRSALKRSAKVARADEKYLSFRNSIMAGYPLPNLNA